MLDPKLIREHADIVRQAAKNKGRDPSVVDSWLKLDTLLRQTIGETETLRARRNILTESISKNPGNKDQFLKEANEIKEGLKQAEIKLKELKERVREVALLIPNIPHESVPVGPDARSNQEIKSWGEKPKFSFPPKDHIALAQNLDLVDFERGAKIGGFRTYFLKNEAAQMELAIMFYTFQKLIQKGYTPVIAPSLVKEFTLTGNAQFPWGKDEVYHLEKDDVYLAGTAEVPVTAYFADEILTEKELPKKFVAFSPCFRREAGSYGKDTKGLYRLHQFNKIEQVVIAKNDLESSLNLHEELLANSESILQDFALPYRVLLMCTGDMGEPQVKKYDIETWMPSRSGENGLLGSYGETMSNSFMGDFQARRLNMRYKTREGDIKFVHTLNNTAIASPRILIAILENYQQANGSIIVPKVLQTLMGKEVIKR